jgi:hypothetical protein
LPKPCYGTNKAECMRQLEAAQGKSTDSEGKEAELFAASLGTLKAKRGEVTGEEIVKVKIYARILARALDKVRAELARTH